jgi:CRP-like cAMP-binding protein
LDEAVEKKDEDRKVIMNALRNHFIFTSLTEEDKEMVTEAMALISFDPGAIVFKQNCLAKSYYVLRNGLLEVIVNSRRVNRIRPGEGFGELALLHDNLRSATVKCIEKSTLWVIDRQTFRRVLEDMNTQSYELNREFLDKVPLLRDLTSTQKDKLSASLQTSKYNNG